MSEPEYLTREKKKMLEAELDNLKTVQRKEIAETLEWAKSLGDLSENAEYSQAREDQARIEARISELEYLLQNALVSDRTNLRDSIDIGSLVRVRKDDGSEIEFTIVGPEDVDLSQGKISHESPVGSALVGKREGDKVSLIVPKGEVKYTILKIG